VTVSDLSPGDSVVVGNSVTRDTAVADFSLTGRWKLGGHMKTNYRRFPTLLGRVVAKTLNQKGLKEALSRHSIVYQWPKIVPEAVSSHARAKKVTGSTLHVEVDSSAWMHELAAIKHVLLQKVNASLDPDAAKIKDVRFYQRSWKKRPDNITPDPVPPTPSDQEIRLSRRFLEPIRDEDLKEILERILEKDRQLKWRRKP
jgi:hypothetical protein